MPLQPSGTNLSARIELRAALRRLRPSEGHILSAEYFSLDESFFDVENVLIYNIGTGTFRNASTNGIGFSRHRRAPACAPNGLAYPHLHRYRFIERPPNPRGAVFCFVAPPLKTSLKPQDVWWRAVDSFGVAPSLLEGTFALHVDITTVKPVTNVAAVVKPFLDGVVCAMHHDTRPDVEAIQRLAAKRQWETALVTRKLQASTSLLGDRRLVACYRNYVKWDPADHLCESCTFVVCQGEQNHCTVTVTPSLPAHTQ